jgi:hypothetical protein
MSLANQFVSAVVRNDYVTAKSLLTEADDWDRVVNGQNNLKADRVYAELLPREWDDVWRCQRRIVLRVARHDDRDGNYVDWTEDSDFVARPQGVELRPPQCVSGMRRFQYRANDDGQFGRNALP